MRQKSVRSFYAVVLVGAVAAIGCINPRSGSNAADALAEGDEAGAVEATGDAADGSASDDAPAFGESRDAESATDGERAADANLGTDTAAVADSAPLADVAPIADVAPVADTPLPHDVAPQPLALGSVCKSDGQCESGHCADGVCCASACAGRCNACAMIHTGQPDGTCAPARDGTDPHNDCAKSAQVCGTDGTCDGQGACHVAGKDVACGQESCSAGMYTPPAFCDGSGACGKPSAISCNGFACQNNRCAMSCNASLPCPSPTLYCDALGKCQAKKAGGDGCNVDGECATGHCAENVCCESACSTGCHSCRAVYNGVGDGRCAPVTGGMDPYNQCSIDPVSTCGKDGACDGAGACRHYVAGTDCRSGSCSNGPSGSTQIAAGKCNGSGACVDQGTSGPCGAFLCASNNMCRTSCSTSSECLAGNYCDQSQRCLSCPQPSAANLLANPGFDHDLSHWDPLVDDFSRSQNANVLWINTDHETCASSGSMKLLFGSSSDVIASQCFAGGEGTYAFGGSFLASTVPEAVQPGGVPWQASCSLTFYGSLLDCQMRSGDLGNGKTIVLHDIATDAEKWINFGYSWFAASGTHAVMLKCEALDDGASPGIYLLLDKLYVRMSGSGF